MARSTFRSQNVQSTPGSDHFWKLRCQKSARRCGAKQVSKSKCTKHTILGPLLEVEMSKKCTPLWREAHFQVKMYKTHQVRTTFGSCDVKKVYPVVARSTFRSQNVQNTCRLASQAQGIVHLVNSEQNVRAFSTTTTTTLHHTLHSNTLHYTTATTTTTSSLHSTTLHCTQLHSITLHYTTLPTLHYTTTTTTQLHSTTLHDTPLH